MPVDDFQLAELRHAYQVLGVELGHGRCRGSDRGEWETRFQRGIDLRKERREGAQ